MCATVSYAIHGLSGELAYLTILRVVDAENAVDEVSLGNLLLNVMVAASPE